jgi:hypothetical protein
MKVRSTQAITANWFWIPIPLIGEAAKVGTHRVLTYLVFSEFQPFSMPCFTRPQLIYCCHLGFFYETRRSIVIYLILPFG